VPVSTVAQVLTDGDPSVRVAALHALAGKKESATHVEAVLRLLMDRNATVRSASAYCLAKMGLGHAVAVAKLLADESATVRGAAALMLSMMNTNDANYSESVVQLLTDADEMVRCAAAIAVMRMDTKDARHVRAVAALLMDQSSVVRSTALQVLLQMSSVPMDVQATLDNTSMCNKEVHWQQDGDHTPPYNEALQDYIYSAKARAKAQGFTCLHMGQVSVAPSCSAAECQGLVLYSASDDTIKVDVDKILPKHASQWTAPEDYGTHKDVLEEPLSIGTQYHDGLVEEWSRQETVLL